MKLANNHNQLAEQAIAAHLVTATGMDLHALDASRLHWVIETRCRHLHMESDAAAYAERLKSSPEERDALIDAVVIPETRFFRDPSVFKHLGRWAPQMAADFPGELRILSAPSSTGQEAFSIAALLQQAGVSPTRFIIDALDISQTALATARQGIFPEDAMRQVSPDLQRVCGSLRDNQWAMHDELRSRIVFGRCNLAEAGALGHAPKYHLILCRNLFIYLQPKARAILAQSLASALIPGGRLILGSADRVEELSAFFSPQKPAASFAFTHRQHTTSSALPYAPARPKQPAAMRNARIGTIALVALHNVPVTAADLFRRAVEHQQRDELRKAERACRQALYLNPQYLPALELLAALWHQHQPNLRLRLALQARIHRIAASPHAEATPAERKEEAV